MGGFGVELPAVLARGRMKRCYDGVMVWDIERPRGVWGSMVFLLCL